MARPTFGDLVDDIVASEYAAQIAEWIDQQVRDGSPSYASINAKAYGSIIAAFNKRGREEADVEKLALRSETDPMGWAGYRAEKLKNAKLLEAVRVYFEALDKWPYASESPDLDYAAGALRAVFEEVSPKIHRDTI